MRLTFNSETYSLSRQLNWVKTFQGKTHFYILFVIPIDLLENFDLKKVIEKQ